MTGWRKWKSGQREMVEEMEEWPAAVSPSRRVRIERGGHRRKRFAWTHQRSFMLGVREDWYGQVGSILRDEGWRRWWFCFLLLPSSRFFFPIIVKRLHLQRSVGALRSSPPTGSFRIDLDPQCSALVSPATENSVLNRRRRAVYSARVAEFSSIELGN